MPSAKRSQLQKSLVGPAGEHFVLYHLYREGMLASLAPPGTAMVDVLVLDPNETVIATIQVKARTYGSDGGWHMNVKHETFSHPRCFYAFVDLEPVQPDIYVVPSSVVADVVTRAHKAWLDTPGKQGQRHKDNPLRRIRPSFPTPLPGYEDGWLDNYKDRWDLITTPLPDGDE